MRKGITLRSLITEANKRIDERTGNQELLEGKSNEENSTCSEVLPKVDPQKSKVTDET